MELQRYSGTRTRILGRTIVRSQPRRLHQQTGNHQKIRQH